MATTIYTKKGDSGTTALLGGTKVSKSDLRIETYGTIDELNSWIGYCSDTINDPGLKTELRVIGDRLFTIGAVLATGAGKKKGLSLPGVHSTDTGWLEARIDAMTAQLPPIQFFVLPSGHPVVSSLHIARCVCRRGERLAVMMKEEKIMTDANVIPYLNRLSDYLFTLARFCAQRLNVEEIKWEGRGLK